jgi:hypothetical protein
MTPLVTSHAQAQISIPPSSADSLLPSSPRCKLCDSSFKGWGGFLMHLAGRDQLPLTATASPARNLNTRAERRSSSAYSLLACADRALCAHRVSSPAALRMLKPSSSPPFRCGSMSFVVKSSPHPQSGQLF